MGFWIFCLIALVVLYFVIRLAVADGMRDAWKRREQNASKPGEWEAWKRGEWEAWKHGMGDDK
jgi:Family of unknown function (DUF6019)